MQKTNHKEEEKEEDEHTCFLRASVTNLFQQLASQQGAEKVQKLTNVSLSKLEGVLDFGFLKFFQGLKVKFE